MHDESFLTTKIIKLLAVCTRLLRHDARVCFVRAFFCVPPLAPEGLVPPELCDELLNFINKRLDNAIGSLKPDEMTPDTGFGTILARKHRYDMYVRPEGVVQKCLSSMLTSPLGQEADGGGDDDDDKGSNGESESSPWTLLRLFQELFDGAADAKFSELSCIISDAGAPRQPLHPDTHWEEVAPIYSIFLALQDIDESMGA